MTIKKLTALLLAVAMLFTLAACDNGGTKDNGGTTTTTTGNSNSTTTTTEDTTTTTTTASNAGTDAKAFAVGTINGNVYENTFLGLGCKVEAEGWELSSAEEVRESNEMLFEDETDDYMEGLSKLDVITDMFATNMNTGGTLNINFENLGIMYGKDLDEAAYLDEAIGQMDDMGAEGIAIKKATFTVAGKERQGLTIEMEMMGITVYEAVVCIKVGDYMANIVAAGTTADEAKALLDLFYAV